MTLPEKAQEVQELFAALDLEIEKFQSGSGLYCKAGCGKCCFKADIEASVLEFLPFALHVYHEGTAEQWLEKAGSNYSPLCVILNPTQTGAGLCSEYPWRGLICRLFGYSARTNKYGQKELVTCQIIKTEQADAYLQAVSGIDAGQPVPVMGNYYMRLHAIDPDLAREFYPIREAIRRALETVLSFYFYQS